MTPFILALLWISVAHSQGILKVPLYIHQKEIWVEVAKTPEERNHGLMGRKHSLDFHAPPRPILYALEMNKSWSSSHDIKAGDVVRVSR